MKWIPLPFLQILMSGLSNPFSIAVFEDRIYWTDLNEHGLFSANKFTGLDIRKEVSEMFGHVSIIVWHAALQIPESNGESVRIDQNLM
jgi:hypothetical protein